MKRDAVRSGGVPGRRPREAQEACALPAVLESANPLPASARTADSRLDRYTCAAVRRGAATVVAVRLGMAFLLHPDAAPASAGPVSPLR